MVKPDKFHYHEVLDRGHTILGLIDELLVGHPAVEAHPETLGAALRKLEDAAADFYQMAGQLRE